jgi:pentapeptide repeat protein
MESNEADVDWPRCTADARCIGVQVSDNGPCLAHLDAVQLGAQLQRLGSGGNLDARGVRFGATLLGRVLATLSRSQEEPAVFKGEAWFERATFRGEAWFGEATFKGEAWFIGTTFDQARTLGPMQASGQAMLDNAVSGSASASRSPQPKSPAAARDSSKVATFDCGGLESCLTTPTSRHHQSSALHNRSST